jgi:hypothetical protein
VGWVRVYQGETQLDITHSGRVVERTEHKRLPPDTFEENTHHPGTIARGLIQYSIVPGLVVGVRPKHVEARVCRPYAHDQEDRPPFLQLIAFGEDGIEVQEINLNQLTVRRGKGKSVANHSVPTHAVSDILGGETAPLCTGGLWHRPVHPDQTDLYRSDSVMSYMSASSYDSNDTEELAAKFLSERGIYGWVRKGHMDWRVFWVGGTGREEAEQNPL